MAIKIQLYSNTCKQKTAYELMPSLVGSEMCIRDRISAASAVVEAPI